MSSFKLIGILVLEKKILKVFIIHVYRRSGHDCGHSYKLLFIFPRKAPLICQTVLDIFHQRTNGPVNANLISGPRRKHKKQLSLNLTMSFDRSKSNQDHHLYSIWRHCVPDAPWQVSRS